MRNMFHNILEISMDSLETPPRAGLLDKIQNIQTAPEFQINHKPVFCVSLFQNIARDLVILKYDSWLIWNSNLTGHLVFLLAKSGNSDPTACLPGEESPGSVGVSLSARVDSRILRGEKTQDQILTILAAKASCLCLTLCEVLELEGTHILIWQMIKLNS